MDELLQILIQAHRRLAAFNEHLQVVSSSFGEEFRLLPSGGCSRAARQQMEEVLEGFAVYLATTGPCLEEYLERIIQLLKVYLYD